MQIWLFPQFLPQIETREDEEQNIKMAETVELLLAAGYFRARIKVLSPFDKVGDKISYCLLSFNCNTCLSKDLFYSVFHCVGFCRKFFNLLLNNTFRKYQLSNFKCNVISKVVGGMTWCISVCDFDIDVDLLFQENSTIGQKM